MAIAQAHAPASITTPKSQPHAATAAQIAAAMAERLRAFGDADALVRAARTRTLDDAAPDRGHAFEALASAEKALAAVVSGTSAWRIGLPRGLGRDPNRLNVLAAHVRVPVIDAGVAPQMVSAVPAHQNRSGDIPGVIPPRTQVDPRPSQAILAVELWDEPSGGTRIRVRLSPSPEAQNFGPLRAQFGAPLELGSIEGWVRPDGSFELEPSIERAMTGAAWEERGQKAVEVRETNTTGLHVKGSIRDGQVHITDFSHGLVRQAYNRTSGLRGHIIVDQRGAGPALSPLCGTALGPDAIARRRPWTPVDFARAAQPLGEQTFDRYGGGTDGYTNHAGSLFAALFLESIDPAVFLSSDDTLKRRAIPTLVRRARDQWALGPDLALTEVFPKIVPVRDGWWPRLLDVAARCAELGGPVAYRQNVPDWVQESSMRDDGSPNALTQHQNLVLRQSTRVKVDWEEASDHPSARIRALLAEPVPCYDDVPELCVRVLPALLRCAQAAHVDPNSVRVTCADGNTLSLVEHPLFPRDLVIDRSAAVASKIRGLLGEALSSSGPEAGGRRAAAARQLMGVEDGQRPQDRFQFDELLGPLGAERIAGARAPVTVEDFGNHRAAFRAFLTKCLRAWYDPAAIVLLALLTDAEEDDIECALKEGFERAPQAEDTPRAKAARDNVQRLTRIWARLGMIEGNALEYALLGLIAKPARLSLEELELRLDLLHAGAETDDAPTQASPDTGANTGGALTAEGLTRRCRSLGVDAWRAAIEYLGYAAPATVEMIRIALDTEVRSRTPTSDELGIIPSGSWEIGPDGRVDIGKIRERPWLTAADARNMRSQGSSDKLKPWQSSGQHDLPDGGLS
ncbi:MAG: hypothetical protein IPK13_07905 [Deltaproteobacteria bacterium]|nr:hypothetical protein [Deltaproteobacteria bacterium]